LRREREVGLLKIKGDFNDLYDRGFELVGSPDAGGDASSRSANRGITLLANRSSALACRAG
jgi:hypothetical protein